MAEQLPFCTICKAPRLAIWVGDRFRAGPEVKDPLYRGPHGHAPQTICVECHEYHRALREAKAANGEKWLRQDMAFWLISLGATREYAAKAVEVSPRTVYRWIAKVKKNGVMPIFLAEKDSAKPLSLGRGNVNAR